MIKKLEPRHFSSDSGFGGATFSDVIDKVNEIIDAMNGEHDPADIYSEDGRLIAKKDESEDERMLKKIIDYLEMIKMGCVICTIDTSEEIAWLEKHKINTEGDFGRGYDCGYQAGYAVAMNKMKPKVATATLDSEKQKEQKPSTGIYWHAIKRGEKLPCRAYIWNPDYEKYHDCWEGRLIPNLEKICVGADTWYLPAKDVRDLPREGVDELPEEQKPNSTEDMPYIADERFYEREPADSFKYKLAEYMTKCCTKKEGPYGYTYGISAESILKMAEEELIKRGVVQKPAEWNEEEKQMFGNILNHYSLIETPTDGNGISKERYLAFIKSLRPRPSWKPSEEQMDALAYASHVLGSDLSPRAAKASEELEHLREQLKKPQV